MFHDIFSTEVWIAIIYPLAILYAFYIMARKPFNFFVGSKAWTYGFLLALFAWLFIGTRPITLYMDTALYTLIYRLLQAGAWTTNGNTVSEWFWNNMEYFCVKCTDASGWLTIIAGFYVGGMCWAAWRWFRAHFTLAVFFLFTAFSFWGYATNGIRNGMATSLMLLALSFITPESRRNWVKLIPAIFFALLSTGTHNTMYLLVACAMIAFFFPSRKAAFWVWGICLLLSPFSTNTVVSLGGSFISDQRFVGYGTASVDSKMFSRLGWRWDFIIYSSMPIILGWYAVVKRNYYDWKYLLVLNVYTYANSFWLLINAVPYSNRFAYLSWFMYPVVLLMPLVKFRLWKSQPLITGLILIGALTFSFLL